MYRRDSQLDFSASSTSLEAAGGGGRKLIEITYVLDGLTSSTLRSKVDHVGVVVEEVEDIYSLLGDKSSERTGRLGHTRFAELIMETVEVYDNWCW